ncbi:MAG: inclusion body family protein [Cytophagales bacterium]|nr:inclusion body family protein [Cytophagales bacterium]
MNNIIDVQVTIDTDTLIKDVPNPSKNPESPSQIGHQYAFMVVTDGAAISGQGGADLSFAAQVGDTVRFHGSSASNNFENAVLLYGMPRFGGSQVFSEFISYTFTKSGVSPSNPAVLPAHVGSERFWFFQANVIQAGTENYQVRFAVYQRDDNGYPVLLGYYQWDPQIVVQG